MIAVNDRTLKSHGRRMVISAELYAIGIYTAITYNKAFSASFVRCQNSQQNFMVTLYRSSNKDLKYFDVLSENIKKINKWQH